MNDDVELFSKIAAGDESAFGQLFHRYTPRLLPFIKKLTRNDLMAAELVQETFMRLWLQREKLNEIENPSAWIYRIASNVSINYLRSLASRKKLLSGIAPVEETNGPEILLETKELSRAIQLAIEQLPGQRQKVYRLSREEGLSHQQIADKLDISVNTVKNQIVASLKFIRQSINKQKGLPVYALISLTAEFFFKTA